MLSPGGGVPSNPLHAAFALYGALETLDRERAVLRLAFPGWDVDYGGGVRQLLASLGVDSALLGRVRANKHCLLSDVTDDTRVLATPTVHLALAGGLSSLLAAREELSPGTGGAAGPAEFPGAAHMASSAPPVIPRRQPAAAAPELSPAQEHALAVLRSTPMAARVGFAPDFAWGVQGLVAGSELEVLQPRQKRATAYVLLHAGPVFAGMCGLPAHAHAHGWWYAPLEGEGVSTGPCPAAPGAAPCLARRLGVLQYHATRPGLRTWLANGISHVFMRKGGVAQADLGLWLEGLCPLPPAACTDSIDLRDWCRLAAEATRQVFSPADPISVSLASFLESAAEHDFRAPGFLDRLRATVARFNASLLSWASVSGAQGPPPEVSVAWAAASLEVAFGRGGAPGPGGSAGPSFAQPPAKRQRWEGTAGGGGGGAGGPGSQVSGGGGGGSGFSRPRGPRRGFLYDHGVCYAHADNLLDPSAWPRGCTRPPGRCPNAHLSRDEVHAFARARNYRGPVFDDAPAPGSYVSGGGGPSMPDAGSVVSGPAAGWGGAPQPLGRGAAAEGAPTLGGHDGASS